jgi:predicted Zn-dependent peptidase
MTGRTIETTHQGIQTVLAPRAGGQLTAGLLFRVGRADETLSTAGITHLVEHLPSTSTARAICSTTAAPRWC